MEPLQESRHLLEELLAQTSRHVDIVSPSLEPHLFAAPAVIDALTTLARRGRNTRIRVIIEQLDPQQFEGHRLLALAKRLTTAMSVKVLNSHPEWNRESVVICDRSAGLLLVPQDKRSRLFSSRAEAQRWAETFERLWLAAEESPELRQLR
jgi:hypothetical protein